MINYNAIGKRIQAYRKASDITQAQLAEAINISTAYISRVECGKAHANLELLDKIADCLHTDLVNFLEDTDSTKDGYADLEICRLTKDWSPSAKDDLVRILEYLNLSGAFQSLNHQQLHDYILKKS